MRQTDIVSSNLFSRLFRYIPREGEKRVRRPLEDFCTEALAYCLIHSMDFRELFLRELDSRWVNGTPVLIHTQESTEDGRPDLVLETTTRRWNGEVKIGAELREAQKRNADFLIAPESEIQRYAASFGEGFITISWEKIHRLLTECLPKMESPAHADKFPPLLSQFADFLEANGMKSIQMKSDLYQLTKTSISTLDELTEFFFKLRPRLNLKRRGSPPANWDYPSARNPCSYYGIYGAANQYCYAPR
jgi:hypothetical protein